MRILHTSDWHAGKAWKGQTRLDELGAVLDDLADVVERERIDLVLMTGDVFDGASPPAEAERLVFGFFRRVGRLGIPSVVIAGNHDSPARVEAWAQLAELAQVTACGLVRRHDEGGCVAIETAGGERAIVGMIPFVGPSQFMSAEALGAVHGDAGSLYARQMQRLVHDVSRGFRPDAVNILMAHTHMQGAAVGASERRVHVAEEWAAWPEMLPATASYVALGHIHRHQRIAAPAPAWYAGAPMQLDFGEEGEPKAFNIVDVGPGQPARVEARPYAGARPLRTVTVTAAQLVRIGTRLRIDERDAAPGPDGDLFAMPIVDVADHPHLRVIVDCTTGPVDPDINRRVRAAIPGVVSVDVIRRATGEPASRPAGPDPAGGPALGPRELYALFLQQHGAAASDASLAAFDVLYQDALTADDQP